MPAGKRGARDFVCVFWGWDRNACSGELVNDLETYGAKGGEVCRVVNACMRFRVVGGCRLIVGSILWFPTTS